MAYDIDAIREQNQDRTPLERERARLDIERAVWRAIHSMWDQETDPLKLEMLTERLDGAALAIAYHKREIQKLRDQ